MYEIKMSKIKSSMPEIFINFLSFLLLGIIATATGTIFFQSINKYFSDVLFNGFSASAIHYSIASLIVGFPIYIWAIWFWFKSFKNLPEKSESGLSKWLTYIILLIAGGTIIGDLVAVVFNFLQGEYKSRFFLKALAVFIIAGLVFGFYFLERKKIQYKKEISQIIFWVFFLLSSVIIVAAIVFGFIVGGTPFEARVKKFDLEKVINLQSLSSCINAFAFDNGRLPANTNELKNNARYSYCASITDSETKKDYEYKVVSKSEFELCAEFNRSTAEDFQNLGYYGNFTKHSQGRYCEKQTVTFGKPLPLEKSAPVPAR